MDPFGGSMQTSILKSSLATTMILTGHPRHVEDRVGEKRVRIGQSRWKQGELTVAGGQTGVKKINHQVGRAYNIEGTEKEVW
jgi:hypothetical protein